MAEQKQACATCMYMIDGKCKYFPPFGQGVGDSGGWGQPAVKADDWCHYWTMGPYPEQPEPSDGGDPEY